MLVENRDVCDFNGDDDDVVVAVLGTLLWWWLLLLLLLLVVLLSSNVCMHARDMRVDINLRRKEVTGTVVT